MKTKMIRIASFFFMVITMSCFTSANLTIEKRRYLQGYNFKLKIVSNKSLKQPSQSVLTSSKYKPVKIPPLSLSSYPLHSVTASISTSQAFSFASAKQKYNDINIKNHQVTKNNAKHNIAQSSLYTSNILLSDKPIQPTTDASQEKENSIFGVIGFALIILSFIFMAIFPPGSIPLFLVGAYCSIKGLKNSDGLGKFFAVISLLLVLLAATAVALYLLSINI